MKAIILAGGKGTRLRPYTMNIPKPLLPLGETPILEVVLRQLAAAGFGPVALTLGHMAAIFRAQLGDGERFGIPLEYYMEEEPLGTAGSLRLVQDPGEHVLVMNGDLLTTLDFSKLAQEHVASGALATIATARRSVYIDFGVVEADASGNLAAYKEKPSIDYEVSMGINMLSRKALELIPRSGRFDMPSLMLAIKSAGHQVRCHSSECYWQDIGRFDDYQRASDDFERDPGRFLPVGR